MSQDELAGRLRALFLTELEEQLVVLNAELLALEVDPTDRKHLGALFRVVHTLKGAAHAARVPEVDEVCHALESLLAEAREGELVLGAEHFSLLFAAADALAEAGRRLRAGEALTDSSMAALRRELAASSGALPRASHPSASEAPRRAPPPPAPPAPAAPPVPAPEPHAEQVRVEAEKLDTLLASAGQLLIAARRVDARSAELEELRESVDRWSSAWGRSTRRLRLAVEGTGASVPVLHALDEMEKNLRRVGREIAGVAGGLRADSRAASRATAEMLDRVSRLRLRPFSEACLALPRMVRDLAAGGGKEVRLEILGGEVEADRAVLDLLNELLLHLVRNAVDHGIEPPHERERVGKPRTGTVTVAASLQGQRLLITVSDDGRGLDLAAIRLQMERRGLRVPEGDDEVARVLFQAGFSTRDEATSVSGRGVGLDIVATTVERIRGSVQVAWEPGAGTTFTLECPPTLATVHGLLVTLGTQLFVVPTAHVERLARVRPEEIRRVQGRDAILRPEGPVPLVSLARLLGPPLREEPLGGVVPVVCLLAGGRRLAVAVDGFLREEEIVVRPLERVPNAPATVGGATLLATGQVALVLNAAVVVAEGLGRPLPGPTLGEAAPVPGAARRTILVVDDSITTRTLEQSILEAAGYEVLTAVDGADGWRLLQERECDLVVSDVEMPRMDGFTLCSTIRASDRLGRTPVVLVTALDAPEHRARGLEAGADAYLPKTGFDHHDLLETIQQLLG